MEKFIIEFYDNINNNIILEYWKNTKHKTMKTITFILVQNDNGAHVVIARNTITDKEIELYSSVIYTHARSKFHEITELFAENINDVFEKENHEL